MEPHLFEECVVIDTPDLILQAAEYDDGQWTVLDATQDDEFATIACSADMGAAVSIEADGVLLEGFRIERIQTDLNSTADFAQGVLMRGSSITVRNNWIVGQLDEQYSHAAGFAAVPGPGQTVEGITIRGNRVEGFGEASETDVFNAGIDLHALHGDSTIDSSGIIVGANEMCKNEHGFIIQEQDRNVTGQATVGGSATLNTFEDNVRHAADLTRDRDALDLVGILEKNLYPADRVVVTDAHAVQDTVEPETIAGIRWDVDAVEFLVTEEEGTVTLQMRKGQTTRIPLTAHLSESLPMVDGEARGVTAVDRVLYVVGVEGLSDPENLTIDPVDQIVDNELQYLEAADVWVYGDVEAGYTFIGDPGEDFTERFDVTFHETGTFAVTVYGVRVPRTLE